MVICYDLYSVSSVEKEADVPAKFQARLNTTPPLPVGQPIPDKTDHQLEVEVEDPKVIATRSSKPKTKKRRTLVKKSDVTSSNHVSSPTPLQTIAPTGPTVSTHSDDETHNSLEDEPHLTSLSSHDSANEPVHHFTNNEVFLSAFNADEPSHQSNPQIPYRKLSTSVLEMMVHLAPLAAQEESNALTNEIALQRAWFNLARGAMDQTDMLERFENLQEDYDRLANAHAECLETIQKLALRIQELEADVAKKDYALVAAERASADGASDREKLSHEYKQSLSEPFNMAIQAGWSKGLSEGSSEEDIIVALHRDKNFDAYFDKNLYPMYDKLFEKEYPYVMEIASGFHHSVTNLLKVYHDPDPFGDPSALTISQALGKSSAPST
ncbi:hypothetical protein Tco_0100022 [Tanacetum coccineum]